MVSFEDLAASIIKWANLNQKLVDTHRGFHFYGQKTATRYFVEEVEQSFKHKVR